MCCFCDDGPIEGDKYPVGLTFKTQMMDAPCADPSCFCLMCVCHPCTSFELRRKVLNYDMSRYSCCQGYFNLCCFTAGECGESSCPECCLCCEVLCCPSCAISATRLYVMDWKGLQSDPCDRRLIRFNNCVQLLACICDIGAFVCPELRQAAQLLRCFADITYCTISACMAAQVNYEIADGSMTGAPVKQVMVDGPPVVIVAQTATTTPVTGAPVYVQGAQPMYAQPQPQMYQQNPPAYAPPQQGGAPVMYGQPQPMQGQPMMYAQQPQQQQQMYYPQQGQPVYSGHGQQPVYVQQPGPQYMR